MVFLIKHRAVSMIRRLPYSTSNGIYHQYEKSEPNILSSRFKPIPKLNCTVTDFIWHNLDRWPDKTAAVCAVSGHGYTYAQTHRLSMNFGASLRKKLKLQNDDTVAVALPNIPEYPCVLFGILQAGCVATPMSPAYNEHEFKKLLETVHCKAIVTSKLSYPKILEAQKTMKSKIPIIMVENDELPEGTIKFAEFAEDLSIDIDCLKSVHRSPDDIAIIPFSSGTTGFPKGVVLTHGSVVALNQMIADPDIVLVKETTPTYQAVLPVVLPFFHIYGLNVVMMNQMHLGCKLVTMPFFKPELFLQTIAKHRAAALFIVPPIALFLGRHPAVKPEHIESLEGIICGAAPLSSGDIEAVQAKNRNINFRQGFGMTETNGTISIGHNKDSNHSSVGHAVGSTQVKIVDVPSKKTMGVGESGEIWFRGPNNMKCYYNNVEATKETLTDDGWLMTGDIGHYDDKGYLYVTDRLKELIKVKGFQVPPAELEAVIRTHPKILDCAVIGIPDEYHGESPKAFIVPQPGNQLTEKELKEFINAKVSEYKAIKHIQFVESIPKSPTGKILRAKIKEKYC